MDFYCKYCDSKFKNNSSLNYHQKNTKYCLEKQGKIQDTYRCNSCDKVLSSKQRMENHKNICNIKKNKTVNDVVDKGSFEKKIKEKDSIISELKIQNKNYEIQEIYLKKTIESHESQIKELQHHIKELATTAINKSTTINNSSTNNTTLNIASFMDFNDIDKIRNAIEDKLDINYVVDGQKGLAHFVKDNILTDDTGKLLYICTDPSRQIFKYKDSTGEVKKDVEAKKLTNYILEGGIRTKSAVLGNEWCKDDKGDINMGRFNVMIEQQQSIMKLSDDNNNFKKELAAITTS